MRRGWGMLFIVCGWAGLVWAQTPGAVDSESVHEPDSAEEALEHAHGPRHGGYFGDAEDRFHYELLLREDAQVVFYVNDEFNQPLDVRALQGRWTLNPDQPRPITGAFTPSEDGAYFLAQLPPAQGAGAIHVEVAVLKDGQWVGMEFFLPAVPSSSMDASVPADLPTRN